MKLIIFEYTSIYMITHYYLGWFNDGFSQKLIRLLHEDITDRSSLVMISANPYHHEGDGVGVAERSWLDQAKLVFDEYCKCQLKNA